MFKRNFIVYLCGEAAYKSAHKSVGKFVSFTHNPQLSENVINIKSYTQFYTRLCTRTCAQKCMQFTSVASYFYTQYTGPTITTTLNN